MKLTIKTADREFELERQPAFFQDFASCLTDGHYTGIPNEKGEVDGDAETIVGDLCEMLASAMDGELSLPGALHTIMEQPDVSGKTTWFVLDFQMLTHGNLSFMVSDEIAEYFKLTVERINDDEAYLDMAHESDLSEAFYSIWGFLQGEHEGELS